MMPRIMSSRGKQDRGYLQKRMQETFMENRSQFKWPRDDREASTLITDFCSDAGFLKRLKLHKEWVNQSATKRSASDTLYYMELSEAAKLGSLLCYGDYGLTIVKNRDSAIKANKEKA